MTPLQACEETKKLWEMLAEIARENKTRAKKKNIPGPWQDYKCHCPCCEFAGADECSFCPMLPEWKVYGDRPNTPCEDNKSPYEQWRHLGDFNPAGTFCLDVEFFCLLIAEMAEDAIKRLEKE